MYNIAFSGGGSKMVKRESFDLDPAKYIFTMGSKTPDSQSIEASPGSDKLFIKTYEYCLNPT